MRLEAILLLAKAPLSTRKLAQLAHLADATEARTLVRQLNRLYDDLGRAMRVEQVAGGYRMLTRPAFSPWLVRLGHLPPAVRLSSPMMETLAVVAYRQPVSRADIEAVRGVACGELVRQLMERDLVRIAGRSEELGRPYLYGTTKRFLQLFGLAAIEALPPISWQTFQTENQARDTDEQIDSIPNDSTTSMKESVVSTALTSVLCETDPLFSVNPTSELANASVGLLDAPVRAQSDEDDDFEDEDDEEEEDDDFDADWDDEEDDEFEDEEEVDADDDEWEEVDDAEDDEEEVEEEADEEVEVEVDDEEAEEADDEEEEDDDWDDSDDEDWDDDDDAEEEEDEEWD